MLEKTKYTSIKCGKLQSRLEQKEQLIVRADNARKLAQDQMREKIEMVLIEKEKVRELEQQLLNTEKDLIREQKIRSELESQLKDEMFGNNSSQVTRPSQVIEVLKSQDTSLKQEISKLKADLKKEKAKGKELEELVEKNITLYENECDKNIGLSAQWQKEKNNAAHYKKRYTRTKETNEKMQKLITELENTITEMHGKLQYLDVEKQAQTIK